MITPQSGLQHGNPAVAAQLSPLRFHRVDAHARLRDSLNRLLPLSSSTLRDGARADPLLQILHNLRSDTAINRPSFTSFGMFCIAFSSKNIFLCENPRRSHGVQRRGPVKGAACPRSSQTLDKEHRCRNVGFESTRVEWGKMEKKRLRPRTPQKLVPLPQWFAQLHWAYTRGCAVSVP